MRRSIDAGLYYPALLVALTVPEICMGLTLPKAIFVKEKHYVSFIETYSASEEIGWLTGLDCFRLRGGVVHRADFRGHPLFEWTHVVFSTPKSRPAIHGPTIEAGEKKAKMLDLESFCIAMDAAARRWYKDHANDAVVEQNLKNLIRLCPNGIAPFILGSPVVASGE